MCFKSTCRAHSFFCVCSKSDVNAGGMCQITSIPTRGEIIKASLNLTAKHPVQALYEYNKLMNYPPPKFRDQWGPAGGWRFDIELGPRTFSCPRFSPKKKDAKAEACKYALQQLGINL